MLQPRHKHTGSERSRSQFKDTSMDRFQKIANEILDRVRSFRGDDEGWKTSKQTVCTNVAQIDFLVDRDV